MRKIIVKEGPLVFLRNVLVMESIAAIFLYAISQLDNYEMLYDSYNFQHFLRYDVFKDISFFVFQLVYIVILFLDWYFSHYEINEKEIIRKTGLLFRRRKSVSLGDVAAVEVYQSPLSRMMHHATIIIEHSNGRVTKLKNVSNFEETLYVIKQMVQGASGRLKTRDLEFLLGEGEGMFVEFKETLRYDTRKGEVSKEMERMVMKTLVGFMNTEGGTLAIGVNDMGEVVGLDDDYKNLPKKNRDGFENHLNMLVRNMIGLPFAKYVGVAFDKSPEGKEACIITVRESHKPAYLRNGGNGGSAEEFFVRVGNSTQPFTMSEAEEYIKTRWK